MFDELNMPNNEKKRIKKKKLTFDAKFGKCVGGTNGVGPDNPGCNKPVE